MGFPGEESLVFDFCLRKELFSATGMRRISVQVVALEATTAEAESTRTGAGAELVVTTKTRNMMGVHGILTHPSEDIMR